MSACQGSGMEGEGAGAHFSSVAQSPPTLRDSMEGAGKIGQSLEH